MGTVRVSLKDRSYDILIGDRILKDTGAIARKLGLGRDCLVVTNSSLFRLYGKSLGRSLRSAGISVRFEMVPDSERAKSSNVALKLLEHIASYDRKKTLFIAALGGGVIGDLTGFVAALYKRGVPYIQIPTTLLAQVDSAIGGKTAIDLPIAKNMIGVFYQPKVVISDVSVLKTLPARQVRNGLAEIIKYGIIKDRSLFEFLEKRYLNILTNDASSFREVIERSSRIKAEIVKADEFDRKGIRAILNYGHTIGHAIEAAGSYSSRYNHGESVAIGMVVAARISRELGMINGKEASRIESLIEKVGLPTTISGVNLNRILAALIHDKKFINGTPRLVLPRTIGRVRLVEGVPDSIIKKVIKGNMRRNDHG